ncbi:MAG: hypothetical protein ACREKE_09920 [bacterium]
MKTIVHYAVGGVIAAALMVLLKLVLSQQAVLVAHWHYTVFDLAGTSGFEELMRILLFGAGYGILFGLLLKDLLPGTTVVRALALACVPTLVDALVLPLHSGHSALRAPWPLLWLYAHWTFYALVLLFFSGSKGPKGASKRAED